MSEPSDGAYRAAAELINAALERLAADAPLDLAA